MLGSESLMGESLISVSVGGGCTWASTWARGGAGPRATARACAATWAVSGGTSAAAGAGPGGTWPTAGARAGGTWATAGAGPGGGCCVGGAGAGRVGFLSSGSWPLHAVKGVGWPTFLRPVICLGVERNCFFDTAYTGGWEDCGGCTAGGGCGGAGWAGSRRSWWWLWWRDSGSAHSWWWPGGVCASRCLERGPGAAVVHTRPTPRHDNPQRPRRKQHSSPARYARACMW